MSVTGAWGSDSPHGVGSGPSSCARPCWFGAGTSRSLQKSARKMILYGSRGAEARQVAQEACLCCGGVSGRPQLLCVTRPSLVILSPGFASGGGSAFVPKEVMRGFPD